jgi:hypothetical protein
MIHNVLYVSSIRVGDNLIKRRFVDRRTGQSRKLKRFSLHAAYTIGR